jgi:hypothetical protein
VKALLKQYNAVQQQQQQQQQHGQSTTPPAAAATAATTEAKAATATRSTNGNYYQGLLCSIHTYMQHTAEALTRWKTTTT